MKLYQPSSTTSLGPYPAIHSVPCPSLIAAVGGRIEAMISININKVPCQVLYWIRVPQSH